jgi:cytochrome c biogenesis protein CcmG, thiol:disulfide interchange protein DsbE
MPDRSSTAETRRRSPLLLIAVGIVVFLGAFAIVFTVLEERGADGIEVADVTVAGEPLVAFTPGQPDPTQGVAAPRLFGVTPRGEEIAVERSGRPTAVVVLAHWCPHCQREVTDMTRWLDETGGVDGVDLFAISTRVQPQQVNYPPSRWLEREGWPVPTLVDDEDASAAIALGMYGTPFWVFLDGDGHVVLRHSGRLEITDLEALLTALADG